MKKINRSEGGKNRDLTHAKNSIWIIHGSTRKITVCSSTFYGVAVKIPVYRCT